MQEPCPIPWPHYYARTRHNYVFRVTWSERAVRLGYITEMHKSRKSGRFRTKTRQASKSRKLRRNFYQRSSSISVFFGVVIVCEVVNLKPLKF